jgi:hypothetical protein
MLLTLIPGSRQPSNDIYVYLKPLVDDLKALWSEGVEVWDQYKREYFTLHAMLFVTINDLPALRNLSGQSKRKGEACPQCLDDTESMWLNESKKIVYMQHRHFVPMNHPYRKMMSQFEGTREKASPPRHFSGQDVYDKVKDINVVLGKRKRSSTSDENGMWNKKSILWELDYWKYLDVHHCIDLMHVEKNICYSLIGTMLNMKGKTKDHENARADLEEMGLRLELHVKDTDKGKFLPHLASPYPRRRKKNFASSCTV